MYVGTLTCDLLLGDVHSLKQKRSVVRPMIAELKRAFDVSAAETGHLDLHRRAEVAVAVVAADAAHCHACPQRLRGARGRAAGAGTAGGPQSGVGRRGRVIHPWEGHGTGETQAGTRTGN